jgi:nitrous oxide reductase accessory protein NosL
MHIQEVYGLVLCLGAAERMLSRLGRRNPRGRLSVRSCRFPNNQKIFRSEEEFMKRSYLLMIIVSLAFVTGLALAQSEITKGASCKHCGMDRQKYAHSWMIIEYDDGSKEGVCSIHCAAVDLILNLDKSPKVFLVGDYGTKNLINAEKATWVIGGSKMGVMTKRAKWAFEKKGDAEKFIKENGGKMASFEEALKAAYDDVYEDSKMIREKRKTRRMEKKS